MPAPPERPAPSPPAKMPRWLSAGLFAAALAAAFWRAPAVDPADFPEMPLAAPSTLAATFAVDSLPQITASAASPTLTQLPDGRLALAWIGANQEDQTDAAVWLAISGKTAWSEPVPIATRESTAGGTFAHVRRLEQPLLHAEGNWLHLWYASHSLGSTLVHSISTDKGKTWSKPERLVTSPFANLGTLPGAAPVTLSDGGIGLAVSHDLFAAHGEWLRLSPTGQVIDKARLPLPGRALHPAAIALDRRRALALLRDAGPGPGKVQVATTENGGQTWQAGAALPLANPDSPLALLRLRSGRLLLAGNGASGRDSLKLWISADEGASWQPRQTVDGAADGGADFSQPALLLGRDGRIHLAYAWRQRLIKLASFSEAWLDGGQP